MMLLYAGNPSVQFNLRGILLKKLSPSNGFIKNAALFHGESRILLQLSSFFLSYAEQSRLHLAGDGDLERKRQIIDTEKEILLF